MDGKMSIQKIAEVGRADQAENNSKKKPSFFAKNRAERCRPASVP